MCKSTLLSFINFILYKMELCYVPFDRVKYSTEYIDKYNGYISIVRLLSAEC